MLRHHLAPQELGGLDWGEDAAQLINDESQNRLPSRTLQDIGGTHHDLKIKFTRSHFAAVEDPLPQTIDENRVWHGEHTSIKPEMDTRNWRGF
jgi:hypothetical protein